MEIILEKKVTAPTTIYEGSLPDTDIASPHKVFFKLGSDTILDEKVPDGKTWTVSVYLKIIET